MRAGWEERRLGELCEVVAGQSPPGSAYNETGDGLPFYQGKKDFSDYYIAPPSVWTSTVTKVAEPEDILMSVRAPVGPINVATERACIGRGLAAIRPRAAMERDFLWYALSWLQPEIVGSDGAVFPSINKAQIEALRLPFPPLPDQRRIVAVLNDAFEGLAQARANSEANLTDTKKVFDRWAELTFAAEVAHVDGVKNSPVQLGQVCQVQSGSGFPKKYQGEKTGDFPFYKVSDMNMPGNERSMRVSNNYVSDVVRRKLGARIFPAGSIVFPKVGGAISTNKKRVLEVAGCVDNNVMGLIPDPEKVLPEFVHEWLRWFNIFEFSNKAALPSITQTTVSGWPIALPSYATQTAIVLKAEQLKEQIEFLVTSYEATLANLAALRQSLLAKAFSGELT